MGLDIDLYTSKIDIGDDNADDIIIEITGLKSISKFIGLEDTPLYYDNGKFFKVEDNKIIYTDIEWKDISGDISESPEIVAVISDLVNEVASDIIDECINLHNLNEEAHPYIQNIIKQNYDTLDAKIDNTKEELSEALNTEIINRETADNELSENIQQETLARIEADTTLQNNINSVASDLSDEISARESADTTLSNSISDLSDGLIQEITDRQTADTGLQSQITSNYNTLDSKIDSVESSLNDLSDTVDANDTAINNKVDNINNTLTNSISTLSDTVSNNYTTLDNKIDSVEGALADSITALDNKYDNITSGLDDKIDDVDDTLTTHISDNSNPHNVTKTQIGLGNVDNTSDLNKPISTATQTALDGKVPNTRTVNNKPLSSDIVLDYSNVNALPDTTTINDLTTTAQQNALNSGIDSTLTQQITTNQNNISNLSSTVSSNYTTLDNRITSEVNTLNGSISDEETARINADNGLQSQIDAITSASDVTDIVGTYAQLQAYDTSTLPPNSIIKVLQDEHQNNETTYYRWVITGGVGSWVLIGEEGPYYTKSEADGRFVPQTRTVNGKALSTNITLDASDVGALPSSTVIPTTDQTFDGTSTNAQSGVAIKGAGFLQNTATGNSSITVNGTATAKSQSINIGTGSQATGNYGTALGAYSFGNASHALGLGNYAKATADYAIQLNKGTNNTSNSLCVGFDNNNYQLLDGTTGLIPDARLSSNIARTSAIPTVNDATLTIQKNGTDVQTFTANASSNVTCNITVPTDTSDLTNNAGYITGITSSDVTTALGYTPYDSSNPNGYTNNIGTVTSVNNVSPVSGNVTLLIPTATSDLTNDSGYITNSAIGNGTITITQGGVTKGTFSTNQSGNTTIALDAGGGSGTVTDVQVNGTSVLSGGVASITVPTATSDLTNDSGFITSSDLPTNHVTTDTDQNITGTKTFVGQKKIAFKQSGTSDKLGFTLYNNSGTEKGYLEYNPSNNVDGVPLMTLGNYATASGGLTHVGFRKYSSISGANGAYNLLTPLISDAKTPFSLTTTYTNFYLPLGFTDGTTTVKTAKSGLVDLSSILPTVNNSTITFTQGGVTKGTITLNQATNGTIALDAGGSGGIQNTATADYSLTIDGVPNDTYQNSINIGTSSISNGNFSVSIGTGNSSGIAAGNYSVSIGSESTNTYETTTGDYSIAIGAGAVVEDNSIAIGYEAVSTGANNILIGKEAGMDEWADNSIAIGYGASVSGETQYGDTGNNITNSIQLGAGINEVSGTLQVWNHQLLNKTTGLIPDARISTNIQRTTNLVTSVSSSSTNNQYPSAKCVYDIIGDIETLLQAV